MTSLFIAKPGHRRQLVCKLIAVFVMVLVLVFLMSNTANAKTVTYEITTDEATYVVETDGNSVNSALDEAGVDVNATDLVSADESTEDGTVQVSVTHKQYATLTVDGSISSIQLEDGDTVADVLERLNVQLGENDIISADLDSIVNGGDSIVVNRVEITYYDVTEESDYEKVREADPDSYRGVEYIKQAGVPGTTTYHHKVTVIDGGEPEDVIESTTTTDMVPEITAYGTRVSTPSLSSLSQSQDYITNIDDELMTITTKSGATYSFSSVESFACTAYTASSGSRTSTGAVPSVGVVAVDPSVISYGTKMFIVSADGSIVYGIAVAGDCGVSGNRIDLYYNSTSACYSFGNRTMKVYFLN